MRCFGWESKIFSVKLIAAFVYPKAMPQHYRLVDETLEIDGVRMHQTARKSPLKDAFDKVEACKPTPGLMVLDICTGLGYCALEAAKRGCWVVTIEKDPEVLELARHNKASQGLFGNDRIQIVNQDALVFVPTLQDSSFDLVLHDPPRLSMAGELYSGAFYRQLFRVLKVGGRLFHYTGTPGLLSGKNIPRGVKERLSLAGFVRLNWRDDLLGFLARKPEPFYNRRPQK